MMRFIQVVTFLLYFNIKNEEQIYERKIGHVSALTFHGFDFAPRSNRNRWRA